MFRDDYVIVIDYLARGYAESFKKEPVMQAVGEKYFSLLELVPREGVPVALRERIYVGADKRDKIQFIRGRISYDKLTATAKSELNAVLAELIKQNEKQFVEFFNKAGAITVRQHSLELLPNIGKKHMWSIIDEREKKPFESFQDLCARVKLMPDPARVIMERVIEEMKGGSRYYLFTRPPREEQRPF